MYGAHAGQDASAAALDESDKFHAIPLENHPVDVLSERLDLADIRNSLKSLMWRAAGVLRDGEELREAAHTIDGWCQYALGRQLADPAGWELQNMLTLSRIMIRAALEREESRGVHQRIDFPDTRDDEWKHRITVRRPVKSV